MIRKKKIRTITIDENTDIKIRDHQANAIKFCSHNVSYSEIVNLLISMTLNDNKKMENIDSYYNIK